MERNYHSLYDNKIFMGGAADVEEMEKNEMIDVVIDLRGEATGCAYHQSQAEWIQIPLGDNSTESHHCGGGKGRTGTVAAGTLLALGLVSDLEDAEARAKSIRPVIDIKPVQKEALAKIFTT
ncbi:protein-tyrosine phosphatase family protein [Cohnella yongneupensis]|uniref:Protein tyrosine phosphatase n=1 Tax=Cohnella yongneupensis TaxID=425006 RepID=A0ABW0QTD0_9BACL